MIWAARCPVLLDPGDGLASPLEVRLVPGEPPQTGIRAGDDRGNGLIDFVGDRGGQRTQCRDPRHMGELGAGPGQGLLGDLAFRHVLNRADVLQLTVTVSPPVSDHVQVLDRVGRASAAGVRIQSRWPRFRTRSIISNNSGGPPGGLAKRSARASRARPI